MLFACLALLSLSAVCVSAGAGLYNAQSGVVELTASNFQQEVIKSDQIWLVEFYAPVRIKNTETHGEKREARQCDTKRADPWHTGFLNTEDTHTRHRHNTKTNPFVSYVRVDMLLFFL